MPLKTILLVIVIMIIVMASCKRTSIMDTSKAAYIMDDNIYIENIDKQDSSNNRFTQDNSIYTINREFIFDYYILRRDSNLKISAPRNISSSADFRRAWNFVDAHENNSEKIENISIKVLGGISNVHQTTATYNYYCGDGKVPCSFYATSGIIENEMNVWMHPHRDKYFMILELNPFPFIQKPYRIGNKWSWCLQIGDHWHDERWLTWSGAIVNNYNYEITGRKILDTPMGKMDCWVVRGRAKSTLGHTSLLAYFNEENGFVKLEYTNIDDSRLIVEIKQIIPEL